MNIWLAAYLVGCAAMLICNVAWMLAGGKATAEATPPGRLFLTSLIWPISVWIGIQKAK